MPEASTRKFSAEFKARSLSRLQAGQTGLLCEVGVGSRLTDAWRKADRAYRATGLIPRDSLIPHFGSGRAIRLRRLFDRLMRREIGVSTSWARHPLRQRQGGKLRGGLSKARKSTARFDACGEGALARTGAFIETVCDPRRLHSAP
jgi:hypothetical protein